MDTRTTLRKLKRAAGGSAAGHVAKVAVTRLDARRVVAADPTLTAVVAALTSPADAEAGWVRRIEAQRSALSASTDTVVHEIDDPQHWRAAIARSQHRHPPVLLDDTRVERSVSEIADQTSKPRDWGVLFYRLVRALRPQRCIEMGTSVGISGSYLAAGLAANGSGRLITLEGQQSSADVATSVFTALGLQARVEARVGWFDDTLDAALAELGSVDLAFIDGNHQYQPTLDYFRAIAPRASAGALLMFDDVNFWSGDMGRAWAEIKADPRVTGTVTVEGVGMAVIGGRRTGDHAVRRLGLT